MAPYMYDLSPKESQRVHINRAGKKAVQNWQYRFKKQIPRLEKDGFIPVMGDEAFFIHDTVSGRKYWSPRGKRIAVPYTGSHKKVTVYGAIAKDGKQFFRTYDIGSTRLPLSSISRRCRGILERQWQ